MAYLGISFSDWRFFLFKNLICENLFTSVFTTKEKIHKGRSEVADYIANYKVDTTQSNGLIRKHWYIENKDHHVKDLTLGEDESRIRVNSANMSSIRSFALNVLRKIISKILKGNYLKIAVISIVYKVRNNLYRIEQPCTGVK